MFATISREAYCDRSFLLVVGHRTIGRTRGRAINTDWRRSMTISIISKEIVRLVAAINDRSYNQSWPPTIDRAINRGILHGQSIGRATGRTVARPVARLLVRPLTIWNSRFQVLNMTIDLVAADLPHAITHDLCDQSYDLCGQAFVLASICPRLQHFRSQVGRNLVVSPV